MNRLVLDHTYVQGFVQAQNPANLAPEVKLAHERLHQGTGAGSDFLGWIDLPVNYDHEGVAASRIVRCQRSKRGLRGICSNRHRRFLLGSGRHQPLGHSFYNLLDHGETQDYHRSFMPEPISAAGTYGSAGPDWRS